MQVIITIKTASDYSNLVDAINHKIIKLQKDMEEVKISDNEETIAGWDKTNKEIDSLKSIVEQLKTNV